MVCFSYLLRLLAYEHITSLKALGNGRPQVNFIYGRLSLMVRQWFAKPPVTVLVAAYEFKSHIFLQNATRAIASASCRIGMVIRRKRGHMLK